MQCKSDLHCQAVPPIANQRTVAELQKSSHQGWACWMYANQHRVPGEAHLVSHDGTRTPNWTKACLHLASDVVDAFIRLEIPVVLAVESKFVQQPDRHQIGRRLGRVLKVLDM